MTRLREMAVQERGPAGMLLRSIALHNVKVESLKAQLDEARALRCPERRHVEQTLLNFEVVACGESGRALKRVCDSLLSRHSEDVQLLWGMLSL